MTITKQLILISFCLACAAPIFAQEGNGGDDYAVTAKSVTLAEPAALTIDADGTTVLSPNLGKLSAGIRPVVRNYMILWCAAKQGPSQVEWTVDAPADGVYEVTASVDGVGSGMTVSCNDQKQQKLNATITQEGWHRIELGSVPLKAGANKVLLDIDAVTVKGAGKRKKEFLLSALELTQASVKQKIETEALAMRNQPDWFKDAGYGLMFQWTNRATPPKGAH